jgi:hypothetical protein
MIKVLTFPSQTSNSYITSGRPFMTDLTTNPPALPVEAFPPLAEGGPNVEPALLGDGTGSIDAPRRIDAFPSYRAVVTARFPDSNSGSRARQQLDQMNLYPPPHTLQWFEKKLGEHPWGDPLPGLAVGELAMIAHVADPEAGEQIVRVCEASGATRTRFYPVQRVVQ